jgi:mRNA-degrading endonuclease toxin of MazEF toxin-antitoxin module
MTDVRRGDASLAGLRLDSIVDCQTLVTVPREEIQTRLGRFSVETCSEWIARWKTRWASLEVELR